MTVIILDTRRLVSQIFVIGGVVLLGLAMKKTIWLLKAEKENDPYRAVRT
jgi:uncharacterized membrane protein YqjE